MKTIEEKAKAYDEAIEKATQSWECGNITRENLEYIFPELHKSKDEKIREWLIDTLKGYHHLFEEGGITKEDMLTWLEKQGEQKYIINVPPREVILSIWDLGNEWKELTNCCISTEYGTQLNYIQKHWHESEYYLKEKQSEHNPIDKIKPKFKVGDVMRTLQEAANNITSGLPVVISIDEEYYHCTNELIAIKDQDNYEYPPMNRAMALSEDNERIRKAAIEFVRQNNSFNYSLGISKKQVVDWLEKQGISYTKRDIL